MIISASRRTDIPTFYSDWFFNRIKEGFVLVRNPMNARQISRVKLTPDVVDGIVLWTKNPTPMIGRLPELEGFMYYFQFTITPYGKDIESNVPQKNTDVISAFKKISSIVGADRIIWRYDPILLNTKYTMDYHIRAFKKIAEELRGYTKRVTISFIDTDYRNLKSNIGELQLTDFPVELRREIASSLVAIAHEYGLSMDTCAEKIDLREYGIENARCIDDRLLSRLLSSHLDVEKDKSQRLECGCISSIDIGMYNTCMNGCLYCYANYSKGAIAGNQAKHDPLSPLLFGEIGPDDKVTDRSVRAFRSNQLGLDGFGQTE
jgi:hypothetical protein